MESLRKTGTLTIVQLNQLWFRLCYRSTFKKNFKEEKHAFIFCVGSSGLQLGPRQHRHWHCWLWFHTHYTLGQLCHHAHSLVWQHQQSSLRFLLSSQIRPGPTSHNIRHIRENVRPPSAEAGTVWAPAGEGRAEWRRGSASRSRQGSRSWCWETAASEWVHCRPIHSTLSHHQQDAASAAATLPSPQGQGCCPTCLTPRSVGRWSAAGVRFCRRKKICWFQNVWWHYKLTRL